VPRKWPGLGRVKATHPTTHYTFPIAKYPFFVDVICITPTHHKIYDKIVRNPPFAARWANTRGYFASRITSREHQSEQERSANHSDMMKAIVACKSSLK
jgi:hypothetical protein